MGVVAKLRKANISFVISVRPFVRPSPTARIFMSFEIWVLLRKKKLLFAKIQVTLKSDNNDRHFT